MKIEVYQEPQYRPCLVADAKAIFHIWTTECKGIIEFDDGTVTRVEPEDIRFLDTESLMVDNICFSDEWVERFKDEEETKYGKYTDKVDQFFTELKRLAKYRGYNIRSTYDEVKEYYRVEIIKFYTDKAMSILGYGVIYPRDVTLCDDAVLMARRIFDSIMNCRKKVE